MASSRNLPASSPATGASAAAAPAPSAGARWTATAWSGAAAVGSGLASISSTVYGTVRGEQKDSRPDGEKFKHQLSNESFSNLKVFVDDLRACGVGEYVQLPQIAVMGDTSSGKSSLLTSISGIEFPSAAGLTTRCPTQLLLQSSEKFAARIGVSGSSVPANIATAINEMKIGSLEDIPQAIQEATQLLCGGDKQFTEDAIVIDVRGPTFPNLTLIDLPGLIRNVRDKEDRKSIDFVKSLVRKYLTQQRTVILAVVPANVDMHNTEILEYAASVDRDGYRTICVITKPDLVDHGAEKQVIDLLMNREKYFRLGYHLVRCRGQQDVNDRLSISDTIAREQLWFDEKEPWSSIPKNLKGIPELKEKLASILRDRFVDTLPDVLKEIDAGISECKHQLEEFGPELTNPAIRRQVFTSVVRNVVDLMSSGLKGQYSDKFFQNEHPTRKLYAFIHSELVEFQKAIARTRVPCLGDLITGDRIECLIPRQGSKGAMWTKGTVIRVTDEQRVVVAVAEEKDLELTMEKVRLQGGEIKDLLALNRGSNLAVFPNFTVFENLYLTKMMEWESPTNELRSKTVELVRTYWKEVCENTVAAPSLRHFVYSSGDVFIDESSKALQERLDEIFRVEQKPYTMDQSMFDELMKLRTRPLRSALTAIATNDPKTGRSVIDLNAGMAILAQFGVGEASMEDIEVMEMSTALAAYVKVSKKRYVDEVAKAVRTQLLTELENKLPKLLFASDEDLGNCMQEKSAVVQRRTELNNKLEALTKGRQRFIEFRQKKI
eukprot:TRINITY_DN71_c0_g1_i2.p1 TRINITY_DN71_c0_g1~~TRINITY_DN71_c0_g1_i2.p1  ORF type:complete len:776 (-),score=219.23 TRINITY_DN71_c0_g1_i2:138-2465(-)